MRIIEISTLPWIKVYLLITTLKINLTDTRTFDHKHIIKEIYIDQMKLLLTFDYISIKNTRISNLSYFNTLNLITSVQKFVFLGWILTGFVITNCVEKMSNFKLKKPFIFIVFECLTAHQCSYFVTHFCPKIWILFSRILRLPAMPYPIWPYFLPILLFLEKIRVRSFRFSIFFHIKRKARFTANQNKPVYKFWNAFINHNIFPNNST